MLWICQGTQQSPCSHRVYILVGERQAIRTQHTICWWIIWYAIKKKKAGTGNRNCARGWFEARFSGKSSLIKWHLAETWRKWETESCVYGGEEFSRHRAQKSQRFESLWGLRVCGMFEEQPGGQCGWSNRITWQNRKWLYKELLAQKGTVGMWWTVIAPWALITSMHSKQYLTRESASNRLPPRERRV